jgi:hypothetical protein
MLDALLDEVADRVGPAEVDEACANLGILIADLVQQCRILRLDAIPPFALVSALERLGPLRPFCGP